MRSIWTNVGPGAALVLGVALAAPTFGADPPAPPKGPPAPHRMEIFSGPNREVHYFGGAGADRAALNNLERAENELEYARNLEALKRQYVNSERTLEPQRLYVQQQLYG